MLFTEPILLALSTYMAFIYGVLFLAFTAYPTVYQSSRRWSVSVSGLAFLGIGVGMALAAALSPLINRVHAYYVTRLGGPVPEARLPHLVVVSWFLPVGLFWFAWTAEPPVHWAWGVTAGVPFGFGLVMLFLGINSYLTDCYEKYSASALAANAMLRSLFGAGFAVFARDMYEKLGTAVATSVLGGVAAGMAVLPWVFWRWGPKLRARSRFHIEAVKV